MTYYRVLTHEELQALKPEFVQFLASRGITADTWQQWLDSDPAKCEQFIQEFSEFIYFSIIDKARFLIRTFAGSTQYIRIAEKSFEMLWFKNLEHHHETAGHAASTGDNTGKESEVYAGKKIWKNPKKSEIFSLLMEGYRPLTTKEVPAVEQLFDEYKNFF